MIWWQTLIVALAVMIVTKAADTLLAIISEKRKFKWYRREKAHEEIESIKSDIGVIYELAMNWKPFDSKQQEYIQSLGRDHQLIGRFNKYPDIAKHARDVVHWCNIIAEAEMKKETEELTKLKPQLAEKYQSLIRSCDRVLAEGI